MSRFDRLALGAVVALAALVRLPGLAARGRFDADQGHDMLTLLAFTRDGVVPLLGPRTSVGEFHHGAFYYVLLAPASAVSGADPVVVTAFIALLGIGAVALTWWLARAIAGPLAGALAGVLLAASPAAIEESTFIWNPNPIGFFAALSLAAAWRGYTRPAGTGRARWWWALAIGAAGAVTQLHVLGIVFLVAIVVLALAGLRRDRSLVVGLVAGLGLVALLFLPLIAHELQTGFLETRRVLDYVRAGDPGSGDGPLSSLVFTAIRVVGWPIVGLVTDVPAASAVLVAALVAAIVLGLRLLRGPERAAVWWLTGLIGWSTVALAFAAPSLQRVVAGLPNDHYHAFLDPVVMILLAVPLALLFERALAAARAPSVSVTGPGSGSAKPSEDGPPGAPGGRQGPAWIGALLVAAVALALVGLEVARKPPHVDPDGGWAAAQAAGARVVADAGGGAVQLIGLPDFKLPDAIGFPIVHAGGTLVDSALPGGLVVVACDRLFEAAIGAACGGPAEDAAMAALGPGAPTAALVDRFDASPRTAVSVYRLGSTP